MSNIVKPASPARSSGTIVLIPARLAATRLPDKPLAEIGGLPMIVQVWRRACEADVGPVVVACADAAIAAAVTAHGGEAVLTEPALPSGTDRIHEALSRLDPARRFERVINLQGDLPTLRPEAIRAVLEPLDQLGSDIGTLAVATDDPAEKADSERGQGDRRVRPASAGASGERSTSRARPRRAARDPCTTTSASMPSGAARSSGSRRCRPARSSSASGSSSCGRWRPA